MVKYKGGYPVFGIEKPNNTPYSPLTLDIIQEQQDSGKYYGELKLNEKRSFICIDAKGKATVYTYRHDRPTLIHGDALERIEAMELPPLTVLDGGHLFRKDLKESKLWIFDLLIWDGREVHEGALDRAEILDDHITTDTVIWRPFRTETWLREFENMMQDKSSLIKKAALAYGVPYEYLRGLIEGLVMKDKKGRLSYPGRGAKTVGNQFKIRLADLPANLKPEF